MNVPVQLVRYDITATEPSYINYIQSQKDNDVRKFRVKFFAENTEISLTNCTATATITIDNVLIEQELACTITDNSVEVTANASREGIMAVQITVTSGTDVLAMQRPIFVRVTNDIAETAQIDDDSHGSFAEIVREVADARGDYISLSEALAHKLSAADGAVKTANLDSGAVTEAKLSDAAVTSAKLADGAVNSSKLSASVSGTIDSCADNLTISTVIDGTANWSQGSINPSNGVVMASDSAIYTGFIKTTDKTEFVFTGSKTLNGYPCSVRVCQYRQPGTGTGSFIRCDLIDSDNGYASSQLDSECTNIRLAYFHDGSSTAMSVSDKQYFSGELRRWVDCSGELDTLKGSADLFSSEIRALTDVATKAGVTFLDNSVLNFQQGGISSSGSPLTSNYSLCTNYIATGFNRKISFVGRTVLDNTPCIVNLVQYYKNSSSGFIRSDPLYRDGEYHTITLAPDCTLIRFTYAHASSTNVLMPPANAVHARFMCEFAPNGKKNAEMFGYDLASSGSYTDLSGYDSESIGADGYTPSAGWSNRVQIGKYIVCDDIVYRAIIKLGTANSGVCALGTVNGFNSGTHHSTIVAFDFQNEAIRFYADSSGDALPETVYMTADMANLSGTDYRIEIGRINRCPYAKVYNLTTGALCAFHVLTEYLETSYSGKAGALYDFPTFGVISGTVTFRRVSANVPADVFCALVGDSITAGEALAYESVWANKVIRYIGSGLNCGRAGGTIQHALRAVADILPAVKPKYVIVTIGTNATPETSQLEQLVADIRSLGAVPIINCIPQNNRGNVVTVAERVLALGVDSCRFDIATSVNNDVSQGINESLFGDHIHPNTLGGCVLFDRFLTDCDWI